MRCERSGAIALSRMVSAGKESDTAFPREVSLWFGYFTSQESISPGCNRGLEIRLRAPGAPGNASDRFLSLTNTSGSSPQHRLDMALQRSGSVETATIGSLTKETKLLIAKSLRGSET